MPALLNLLSRFVRMLSLISETVNTTFGLMSYSMMDLPPLPAQQSQIVLTVSDMRESILTNLDKRFQSAGIRNHRQYTFDLLKGNTQHAIFNAQYSMIVADVPCSGSGTWSRTPEQLYYFDETKIESYSSLQKSIVSKIIPQLQPGGSFVYITCSVFKKENEDVVEYVKKNFKLKLIKMELLKGYERKADSMFVALFNGLSS